MTDDTFIPPVCGNCGQPVQAHPVTDEDGDAECDEFLLEIDPDDAPELVLLLIPRVGELNAECAALRAERDALRADLLSIHGSQDAALPGWAWEPIDRVYVKRTDRGDPFVQVKADFTPPYSCDGEHRGNGFRWTSVGVDNHWIGYGWSTSPAQAMRDADAAMLKPKPLRARHAR